MVDRGILMYTSVLVLLFKFIILLLLNYMFCFQQEVYWLCLQIILFSFKSRSFRDSRLQNFMS